MTSVKKIITSLFMIGCLAVSGPISVSAATTSAGASTTTTTSTTQTKVISNTTSGKIVTSQASLPVTSKNNVTTVRINGGSKFRTYRIFSQKAYGKNSFINIHGCAECSLTTVLSAYTTVYKNYTPGKTTTILEKKVFGKKIWKKNYSKKVANQRPVSLLGISKILKKVGVKNTYIRKFTNANAINTIKKYLYTGNPVIIEVNCHKQTNGTFASTYTNRWARTKHTLVLLGITETGKVIVADSANRTWSGMNQRIKYSTVEELVKYMIPCKSNPTSYYYKNTATGGGFILVNR